MHETSTFMCIYALISSTELPPESATFCPEVCVSLFNGKGLTFFLRNEKLVSQHVQILLVERGGFQLESSLS